MVRLGITLYKLPVTFTLRDQQDTCTMFLQSHEALPCPQAFKQQPSIAINYTEFSCVPSETKYTRLHRSTCWKLIAVKYS